MKKRSNKLLALFVTAAMTATSGAFTAPVFAEDMDTVQAAEVSDTWDETDLEEGEQFITDETPVDASEEYTDGVEEFVENEGFDAAEDTDGFSDGEEEAFSSDFEEGATDELNTQNDVEVGKAYSVKADTVMVETGKASGMYAIDAAIVTLQSDGTYLARLHQKSKNRNILAITDSKDAATKHEVTWYVGAGDDGYWFTVPVKSLEEPLIFAMGSTSRASKEFGNTVKCTFDVSSMAASDANPVESSEIYSTQDLTANNTTAMFKVKEAFLAKSVSGQALYITLSGTGYENLFKGTYEEAVANGDNRDNWLGVIKTADGYRFGIPVEEGETKICLVSVSNNKLADYTAGKVPLERAFYPRQITIDYSTNTITAGDFDHTISLEVKNSVNMFKVASASLHTVGGPNSNNYKETLQLTMGSDSYDKVFVGSAADAQNAQNTIAITDRKADIVVKENAKGGDAVTDYMGKEVNMAFHAVKSGKWFDRIVTVNKADKTLVIVPAAVPATAVSVSETEKTVHAGETFDLAATVTPKDSTDKVVWSSDNEKIAKVDENGKVTAVTCGSASITAKAGNVTAQCKVTVAHTEEVIPAVPATPGHTGLTEGKKCSVCGEILVAQTETAALPVAVSTIKVSAKTSAKIAAGKKVQLQVNVAPENADNKEVTWNTSNKKVATVNAKGVVTMKKNAGGKSVVITATAKDGSKVYGSIKLTCMKGSVKSITISGKKSVKAGKTLKLKANVKVTGNANKKVAWSSSNKNLATVSSKGVVKTFKGKKGTVKITVKALDGSNKKKTISIKIK